MVPRRLLRISIGVILAVMAVSSLLYHLGSINIMNRLPNVTLCPFHAITGISCPGCGMTRALLSIGQLRFGEGIHWNPFSIPLLIVMGICFCHGKTLLWLRRPWITRAALIGVMTFWIIRLMTF
jgi:hypothetical protein